MRNLAKTVWGLWPSLEEMADDLTESVNRLRLAHGRGELPDARHDQQIAARANLLGKRLTIRSLRAFRVNGAANDLDQRREKIGALIEKAGGYAAASERTGLSVAHLRVCKSRGSLPRSHRLECRDLAAEVGFDLPSDLFVSIPR